jgi:hypothetical protein
MSCSTEMFIQKLSYNQTLQHVLVTWFSEILAKKIKPINDEGMMNDWRQLQMLHFLKKRRVI